MTCRQECAQNDRSSSNLGKEHLCLRSQGAEHATQKIHLPKPQAKRGPLAATPERSGKGTAEPGHELPSSATLWTAIQDTAMIVGQSPRPAYRRHVVLIGWTRPDGKTLR